MPKTKAIGLYADRKEAVRRVINIGLARSGLTGRDLDRRNIININTLTKRKAEGETIRPGSRWLLPVLRRQRCWHRLSAWCSPL